MALQIPAHPSSSKPGPTPTRQRQQPASPTADLARLRRSLDSSVSDNTRKMYNSAWRGFQAWAQARGALALPASPALNRRLPGPPGRGTTSLGGHHPAPQGRPGRDPQGRWPRRPHRQRGRETHHAGHRAGPRQSPAPGKTPNGRGPGRGEGDSEEPAPPERRETARVGGKGFLAGPGGRGPAVDTP